MKKLLGIVLLMSFGSIWASKITNTQANVNALNATGMCPGCDLSSLQVNGDIKLAPNVKITDLSGATLLGANLAGLNLSNANLSDATLTGAILTNTNFSGAKLDGADLSNASLNGANFANASLTTATIFSSDLTNANFENANLNGAGIGGSTLQNTGFAGATLTDLVESQTSTTTKGGYTTTKIGFSTTIDTNKANFSAANLSGAQISGTPGTGFNFLGANLQNANLTGMDLRGSTLNSADLSNANLSNVNLSGVYLPNYIKSIKGANLSGANLSGNNLGDGSSTSTALDWTGVNFVGANLTNTSLTNYKTLSGINFNYAILGGATITAQSMDHCILDEAKFQSGSTLVVFNITNSSLRDVDFEGGSNGFISSIDSNTPIGNNTTVPGRVYSTDNIIDTSGTINSTYHSSLKKYIECKVVYSKGSLPPETGAALTALVNSVSDYSVTCQNQHCDNSGDYYAAGGCEIYNESHGATFIPILLWGNPASAIDAVYAATVSGSSMPIGTTVQSNNSAINLVPKNQNTCDSLVGGEVLNLGCGYDGTALTDIVSNATYGGMIQFILP